MMICDWGRAQCSGFQRSAFGVRRPAFGRFDPASGIRNLASLFVLLLFVASPARAASVVVYTSQDQVFAEPIFKRFTEETGVEVKAVYDSEAVKTVGLVNRLMAEKSRPRCDLFWNNEELRTVQLAQASVLDSASVTNFGHRQRQLVIRSSTITNDFLPLTLADLTNSLARGKVALAYPLFGTTASHFLALRERMGETAWKNWCRALAANRPLLVDGNSVVVKLVASGQALVGLTDSDDIRNAQREGHKVMPLSLSADDGLSIRNSAALVTGGPNPAEARRLLAFLSSPATLRRLVEANAIDPFLLAENGEVICGESGDIILAPWPEILKEQAAGTETLREIFLR